MKQQLKIAFWMTIVTTILFGIVYPLVVTALAQVFFPAQANGEIVRQNGTVIGSHIIGQAFSSPGYFYSRPSNANYDGLNSGGTNLGPTNRQLIEQVEAAARNLGAQNPGAPIPVDLVTGSGSGLDPDISVAAAEFQIPRVAQQRGMSETQVRTIVREHMEGRQFGILGEPRVNLLGLNLALDAAHPMRYSSAAPARERASLDGSNR